MLTFTVLYTALCALGAEDKSVITENDKDCEFGMHWHLQVAPDMKTSSSVAVRVCVLLVPNRNNNNIVKYGVFCCK